MAPAEPRHFRHPLHDLLSTRLAAWRLECADTSIPCDMRLGDDVAQVSEGCWRVLSVGRSAQNPQFWERLLPDEVARNTVSREQFEILGKTKASEGAEVEFTEFVLKNLSGRGTVLNNAVVHHEAVLRAGDSIAVGLVNSEYGCRPALHFRFVETPMTFAAAPPAALLGATVPSMLALVTPELQSLPQPEQGASGGGGWYLACVAVAGREGGEVVAASTSLALLPREDGGDQAALRVGRAVQLMFYWEGLVHDQALRNAISREHFEVVVDLSSSAATLTNRSSSGTLVNGALVREHCVLRLGDIVAVPRPKEAGPGDPIVQFRFAKAMPGKIGPPSESVPAQAEPNLAAPGVRPAVAAPCVAVRSVSPVAPGPPSEQVAQNVAAQIAAPEVSAARVAALVAASSLLASDVDIPPLAGAAGALVIRELPATPESIEVGAASPDVVKADLEGVVRVGATPEHLSESREVLEAALAVSPQAAPAAAAVVAEPANSESVPMVKISISALPPPFTLTCVAASGLTELDVANLARAHRVIEASLADLLLRVGSEVQPPELWAALLPAEAVRAAVAPSHFEIRFSDEGEILLLNLSPTGTLLNGKRVLDHAGLLSGDFIAISPSMAENTSLLTFRLSVAGAEEEEDSE
eukprot:CAMPEP_0177312524 /NCGR_PEP_ID=MMETSP0368-20130122/10933_1 /TAXON_ID=447022 ORGANISM="Scrippsiella hangoei-like, Strain SHHI-4" /NCGR_SAMPLE_ID=MMETSP0368 /ASSEMBLY_ACC=CAM_ASM_000363 /LENGTH=640 /DNA_ID=CAMNT_0018771585 /DNA_START=32 /DNA_END=1954 /DNA_ORIENTATION=-